MRLSENTGREFAKVIDSAQKIVLISHRNPDGDTIGAALAMYEMLLTRGKEPTFFCVDPLPEDFHFLPNSEFVLHKLDQNAYDLAIMMDAAAHYMSGIFESHPDLFFGKYPLVNIDHHMSNEGYGKWNLVDSESASTTIVLTHLFNFLGWKITPKIATCLMTGLYTDTGSLKHSNADAEVHRIAGELLRSGARLKDIVKYIFRTTKVSTLRLWGRVMKRITQTSDHITLSYVSEEDFSETEAKKSDLSGVVDYLNAVPDARFSLLLTETEGKVKGSLRTLREDVDLTEIAGKFGGGGHKKASGFTVTGKLRLQTRFVIESDEKKFEDSLLLEGVTPHSN
ncbi:DHH family phosphoesterase [Candidatus Peregrinibacteria bacterium]|nr:DHH family phosphoesterase [Candidatus Peregrinibacteria bacterium]